MVRLPFSTDWSRQRQLLIGSAVLLALVSAAATPLVLQRLWQSAVLPAAPIQPRSLAPAPPAQAAWHSPLRRQCRSGSPLLAQRLQELQRSLPERTRRLRIDPSNYGQRHRRDAFGRPVAHTPQMVVLHETVYGLNSAINTFTTHHP